MSTKKTSKKSLKKKTAPKKKAKTPDYTSKRAWKLVSPKHWPPPDNPMARHAETEADLLAGGGPVEEAGAKPAQRRLAALEQAQVMAPAAVPPGSPPAAPVV